MEGTHCYGNSNCSTEGLTLPAAEYGHALGCSVTGGYVYRGTRYPALSGLYLFGDFCSGTVWAMAPPGPGERPAAVVGQTGVSISSFGEDENGELYLTDLRTGSVYLVTGQARSPSPRRPSGRIPSGSR